MALFGPDVSPETLPVAIVTGTLAEKPEVHAYGKNTSARLLLNEYPRCTFIIGSTALDATKWVPLSDDLYPGDTVIMEVAAQDYKDNIEGYPSNYVAIDVFALRCKGYIYLSLTDYCNKENDDALTGIILLVMGSTTIITLFFTIRARRALNRQNKNVQL
ncbi:MAG: hypothetical protein K0Q79_3376 [Flavipsychrobacter sp.]|nr:hypothetical protein [Flavipsychrobacter sp.]